jgi:hypothetical protein
MGGITISTTTTTPLFKQTKQTSAMKSTTVYRIAASTSTRIIGITLLFEARSIETARSIVQMRYASNPGHIQGLCTTLSETCLPELNKLVAIVEAMNAVTHWASISAKMVLLLACEQL